MLSKLQNLKWPGKEKADAKNKPVQTPSTAATADNAKASTTPDAVTVSADLARRLQDPAEKIRTAACLELKDVSRLLDIAQTDSSDNIRLIAARQYARLLPTDQSAKQILSNHFNSPATRHLAILITALHNDAEVRQHGLALFDSDEDYLKIAVETRFHDTRQTVAGQIQTLELVDQCYRKIKSKDKIVARELKQRLTERQELLEQHKLQQEEITKITDEMQKLAEGAWSPTLSHRYDLFANMWRALDFDITPQQKDRYELFRAKAFEKAAENLASQKHHDECAQVIQSLTEMTATLKQAELENLGATTDTAVIRQTELLSRWQSLLNATETSNVTIDKSHQQQFTDVRNSAASAISNAKDTIAAYRELNEKQNTDPDKLKKQLSTLQALQKKLDQSQDIPLYANDIPQLLKSTQEAIKQRTQQSTELKASINKQFGSLTSAISSNRWGPAKSIHERLEKKIGRLAASDKKHYTEKLQRLEKKLNELGDWKQFATEPKLESLCELMEQVPSLGLNPADQADRIKELQTQWKSMGANPAQEKHWPRFKAAADIAYEPCAEFFARKRAEKAEKLTKRAEICDMLQAYIDKSDWQNPDWKLVEKTIRTAKTEWRNTRVYDRKGAAKLEERFTNILAALNEKLEPAYSAGAAEKTELIEKVKALSEGDINQHCINQLKRLQSMWKRTGTTRRADDQKLWTVFNDSCSEIYNKYREIQREHYAASVEHVTRARQIIAELKAVQGSSTAVDEKRIQQLQDEFQALPEFPEKDHKHLQRDYNRAIDGVEQQRQKMTDTALQQEIQRLHYNAQICEQLETLAGGATDTTDDDIERILTDWNDGEKTDNPRWKRAIALRKDSIVTHLKSGTPIDFESNTQARRLLCIENEILHDKETPSEDKQLRMQYQLEKLQQGMSTTTASSHEQQSAELEFRWLTAFPASPEIHEKLKARFNSAAGK